MWNTEKMVWTSLEFDKRCSSEFLAFIYLHGSYANVPSFEKSFHYPSAIMILHHSSAALPPSQMLPFPPPHATPQPCYSAPISPSQLYTKLPSTGLLIIPPCRYPLTPECANECLPRKTTSASTSTHVHIPRSACHRPYRPLKNS
jgi:hypothetical protein